jgi:aspartate aminotransferase
MACKYSLFKRIVKIPLGLQLIMNQVSERLQALSESETLAMARASRELRARGIDIVSLSLGEPDYDTPDFIKQAAKKAIDENFTHYPPVAGFPELRAAVCRKFQRDNGLDYKSEQIVISTGAKQSIANVIMSLINPGDEVVLPAPYWVSYAEMVKLAGGIPVPVYAGIEQDYKVNAAQIEPYLTPKTRLLIFSSPCNPTGSVMNRSELEALADLLRRYPSVLVISDEIYEHIRFEGEHISFARLPDMFERTVTVNGLSKGFAMTGWRLGFIGAPLWIAQACDKFQGQITSGACSITQRAAIAALDADPGVISEMIEGFRRRRALMADQLKSIPDIRVNLPQGAFYFFPDVSAYLGKKAGDTVISTTTELCHYLLYNHQVAVVSGLAFGCHRAIRLSYATADALITEAIHRLSNGLKSLQ